MDLSKFKKIGRTRTHTIMEHPDGHIVHLKMAEGGETPPVGPGGIPLDPEKTKKFAKVFKGYAEGTEKPIEAPPEMKDSPPLESLPAPIPSDLPPGPNEGAITSGSSPEAQAEPTPSSDFTGKETEIPKRLEAAKEEQDLTQKLALQEKQGAEAQVKKIETGIKVKNDFENKYQEELKGIQGELETASKDINNGYFHAKDIFNKGDTWGNVVTGIGLILGGIGGGILHKENPVMKMLTDKIDRDIEAGGHLYKALEQKYGNRRDALTAERIYKYSVLADELQKAGLQASGEKAKTQVLIAGTQVQDRIGSLMGDLAKNQVIEKMVSGEGKGLAPVSGKGEGAVDYGKFNKLQLMSQLKVPGAPSSEELTKMTNEATQLEEARALRKDFDHAFKELNNKAFAGKFSPNQRDSYINSLAGKLAKASAGRYNQAEAINQINSMMPQATDVGGTRDVRKKNNAQFFDILEAGTPTLNRFGIKNAPVADEEIKTFNGHDYKKVEGGWQRIK